MTLKMKQCFFARPVIPFLGHIAGSKMSVVSGIITAIKAPPEPYTEKITRKLSRFMQLQQKFFLLVSGAATPLTNLTEGGKGGSFKFTDHQHPAFKRPGLFKAIPVRRQRVRYRMLPLANRQPF